MLALPESSNSNVEAVVASESTERAEATVAAVTTVTTEATETGTTVVLTQTLSKSQGSAEQNLKKFKTYLKKCSYGL